MLGKLLPPLVYSGVQITDDFAPIVFDSGFHHVREIKSREASIYYGRDRGWCTANPDPNRNYFSNYGPAKGRLFYFFSALKKRARGAFFLSHKGNWNEYGPFNKRLNLDEYTSIDRDLRAWLNDVRPARRSYLFDIPAFGHAPVQAVSDLQSALSRLGPALQSVYEFAQPYQHLTFQDGGSIAYRRPPRREAVINVPIEVVRDMWNGSRLVGVDAGGNLVAPSDVNAAIGVMTRVEYVGASARPNSARIEVELF